MPTLDDLMNRFRLASRELFNGFFFVQDPYTNDGWIWEERFRVTERVLFASLVSEPAGIDAAEYGSVQFNILVQLRHGRTAPILLNRDVDSGYWDYPLRELNEGVSLAFMSFFDWDALAYRDNRYVRVQVKDWPEHTEVVGKHALVESHYVRFVEAKVT